MSRPAQWKAESSLQNCGNFPTEHVMPRAQYLIAFHYTSKFIIQHFNTYTLSTA